MPEAKTEKLHRGAAGAYKLMRADASINLDEALEARAKQIAASTRRSHVDVKNDLLAAHLQAVQSAFDAKQVGKDETVTLSAFRLNDTKKEPEWPLWWVMFRVGVERRYVEVRFIGERRNTPKPIADPK